MKRYLVSLLSILFFAPSYSQVAKTQVVMVSAIANSDGTIKLSWPAEVYTGQFSIYKRSSLLLEDWGQNPVITLAGTETSWVDQSTKSGEAFEYLVVKASTATDALGYIYAGNKMNEETSKGGLILAIDSNYIIPLQNEIIILKSDLISEGWILNTILVGRSEKPEDVKSRIVEANNSLKNVGAKTLFLLGHIPVPYSGYFSANGAAPPPDGHVEGSGNHTGAWPADGYYGVFNGMWTDNSVNCTTGTQTRNHNIPGDGKFDNTKFPGKVELEIGRVDLFGMPAFSTNDTMLVKKYLDRNHLWRIGKIDAKERALIDNNFSTLNLASTGYQNFSALVKYDSIFSNRDYMTSQKLGSYLWSYGCGAGSYTTCSGIGNTNNFVNDSFNNIFTILAGSFFGDWDVSNNYLRAPLASSSLASFWGGIPKWYVHHMGLGKNIGYGAMLTQNNTTFYFNGSFNLSSNSVHIALMGDPTLRMRNLSPPSNLNAISSSKKVLLWWNPSEIPAEGYVIYKIDSVDNSYERVNQQIISDTFYVDNQNYFTGRYKYAVASIRLETTASGSYYNLSGASFADVDHINSAPEISWKDDILIYPNPATENIYVNSNSILNFEIFSIDGKSIGKYSKDNICTIDCKSWLSGVYFFRFTNKNGMVSIKKVVKI